MSNIREQESQLGHTKTGSCSIFHLHVQLQKACTALLPGISMQREQFSTDLMNRFIIFLTGRHCGEKKSEVRHAENAPKHAPSCSVRIGFAFSSSDAPSSSSSLPARSFAPNDDSSASSSSPPLSSPLSSADAFCPNTEELVDVRSKELRADPSGDPARALFDTGTAKP